MGPQTDQVAQRSPSVSSLAGVGPAVLARLQKLGILTIADLVSHYPRRYEDWTSPRPITSLRIGEAAIIQADVVSIDLVRSARRRFPIIKALLRDPSGTIQAIWFNQPYLVQTLKPGEPWLFAGSVSFDRSVSLKQLQSPRYERIGQIYPIYPETAGLSSKQLRNLIDRARQTQVSVSDFLPSSLRTTYDLLDQSTAETLIHHPDSLVSLGAARRRLAFNELFLFHLRLARLRQIFAQEMAPTMHLSDNELKGFTTHLPFTLTDSQRRSAWEIIQDLGKPVPMNRLLEGDVGSGKTVVGAFAVYLAAKTGYQTMWLAPTDLLARQHFDSLTKLLSPHQIPVRLWTAKTKMAATNEPEVVVGTQALFNHLEDLDRLGLVLVDEQHRFGVSQRTVLRTERLVSGQRLVPHFLSMTATPIPRTLGLALFGDLDVSMIDERPLGRQPITTKVIQDADRSTIYRLIAQEVAAGRQAYIVYPLIDPTESTNDELFPVAGARSVTTEFDRLAREVFPKLRLGLLHGRLAAKKKQEIMTAFQAGKVDVLVATTVIEVGIDVPNATVMVIEGADHFGLAQLHQLRGRIGRGSQRSTCFLLADQWSDATSRRLTAMTETESGFRLAEIDLELRGPGEFLGTAQAGLPSFKLASLMDYPLMQAAQAAAQTALEQDLISPVLEAELIEPDKEFSLE